MANKVCHFEIVSDDLWRSAEFYGKLFGWESQPWGEQYMMFSIKDGIGGGFFKRQEGAADVALYILVDDIDAKLAEIVAEGCEVLVPKKLISEDIGYYALFKDPSGVPIGLFAEK
jgi:predicted enzyme related to lactoylglutathione lyase